MANLTSKQKKQKNSFIAMMVAIVIVIAAIAYVLFGGLTAKSDFLANQELATALSKVLNKAPAFITEEDLAQIKYFSFDYNAEEEIASIMTGDDTFVGMYYEYLAKLEAEEDVSEYDFTGLYKTVEFDLDKEDSLLDDIKYFTGVRNLDIAGASFTDSTVFSGLTNIEKANINSCGLTEVGGFGGLNPDKVIEVNFTGNNITDWSPLDIIKDKVIVSTYYTIAPTEDGSFDFNNMTLVEQTLTEYYEELAQAQESENAAQETTYETAEDTAEATEETAE